MNARIVCVALLASGVTGCVSNGTRESLRATEALVASKGTSPRAPDRTASSSSDAKGVPSLESAARRPESPGSVDLPTLERRLLSDHPALVEATHRVRSIVADARAAGALPPPELMVDLWGVPLRCPYAVDDASMLMVSLSQEFPAPGSLGSKSQAVALEARAAVSALREVERDLLRELDLAFFDYVEAKALAETYGEHLELLAQIGATATARYASGGRLSDITSAELERSRALADLERTRGRVHEARARINGLLQLPGDAPLGPPRIGPPLTVGAASDSLVAMAMENSPEVARAASMKAASSEYAEAAEAQSNLPSFKAGLSYFHPVGEMPAGWGGTVGMSLPWLWGEASQRYRGARHRAMAGAAGLSRQKTRIAAEVARALAIVKASERQLSVLRTKAAPSARRAIEAAQAGYASGATDLLAWLDAVRMSLNVRLEIARVRAELDRALAELDAIVGTRVPRIALLPSAEGEPS